MILLSLLIALPQAPFAQRLVAAAHERTRHKVVYTPAYIRIAYPGGDVPAGTGVCTDVVIRAYRAVGVDLQRLVHEDMRRNFSAYPSLWALSKPDSNIDHRRVPNLRVFFTRHGRSLPISRDPSAYLPGDLVTWNLKTRGSLPHIGVLSSRRSIDRKRPLVVHNIGAGPVFEDLLFAYRITGHYRFAPK